VAWPVGRSSHRTRRQPNGGVGGEPATERDSKSDPYASTQRVWREQRPAEGVAGGRRQWRSQPPPRRRDRCRPPPPQGAGMQDEWCRLRDTAVVLRGAPATRQSSGAG